jgi:hypothetical protein
MRTLRFLLVAALTLIPAAVYAAETNFFGPIVPPCTEGGTAGLCQACNLVQLGQNILRFFVSFSVVAATVMFAYAGFLYVSASSNRSNLDSAKTIFTNTLIGLILILTAYLIIDLTLKVLTGQPLSAISKIQCVKQDRSNLKATYTPVEDAPGQGAPEEEQPAQPSGAGDPTGKYCGGSGWAPYSLTLDRSISASSLPDTVPSDIGEYCPKYASMSRTQRVAFWNRYMSSVAKYESSCKSNPTPFNEAAHCRKTNQQCFQKPDVVTGKDVLSEGFFQLSYGSEAGRARASGGKHCVFDHTKGDIVDPGKNIDCGIYILATDTSRSGSIAGGTRYWSVSRTKKTNIIDATSDVPGCR